MESSSSSDVNDGEVSCDPYCIDVESMEVDEIPSLARPVESAPLGDCVFDESGFPVLKGVAASGPSHPPALRSSGEDVDGSEDFVIGPKPERRAAKN